MAQKPPEWVPFEPSIFRLDFSLLTVMNRFLQDVRGESEPKHCHSGAQTQDQLHNNMASVQKQNGARGYGSMYMDRSFCV